MAAVEADRGRGSDFRRQRPEPDFQPRLTQHVDDLRHILQIELVARVVFRNEQEAFGLRAEFFDRAHRCLHAQRQKCRIEVIEPPRKKIGIDRRQLETGIAQID